MSESILSEIKNDVIGKTVTDIYELAEYQDGLYFGEVHIELDHQYVIGIPIQDDGFWCPGTRHTEAKSIFTGYTIKETREKGFTPYVPKKQRAYRLINGIWKAEPDPDILPALRLKKVIDFVWHRESEHCFYMLENGWLIGMQWSGPEGIGAGLLIRRSLHEITDLHGEEKLRRLIG